MKTNFAGDTSSLYRNAGNLTFDDQTFQAGLGKNTRFLGWGAGFIDYDNDGWADIFMCNGHVYPEVRESALESGYRERKVVYHNLGNRKFEDVSMDLGPGITEKAPARGCAFGDFDNDGDVDVLVNCVNDVPQLLRCDSTLKNSWIKIKLMGMRSNRSAIGARVYCMTAGHNQMQEVRSGSSYLSQSDFRLHFGLGVEKQCSLEIRWPSGQVDNVADAPTTGSSRLWKAGDCGRERHRFRHASHAFPPRLSASCWLAVHANCASGGKTRF